MSKIGLGLKINLSAMDVARLFQGQKGQYLDATVFVDLDELDQYGNSGMITQDVSAQERTQGVKGNILGNCKVFFKDGGQAPQAQQAAPQQQWQPQQAPQQAPQMQQPQQMPVNPLAAGGRIAADYAPQPQPQAQAAPYDEQIPF